MPNFTKKAIRDTFLSLLEEHPLSEITIKDIVSRCGINRNTFYYHYQDLPALIEEIVREEAESVIEKYPSVSSIVECFDVLTEFASHRKRAIMHIYRSLNREVFERHLMRVSEAIVQKYVDTALTEDAVRGADKQAIVDYYKCVCFGLILQWLNIGMDEKFAVSIRRIFLVKKDMAQEIATLLGNQV